MKKAARLTAPQIWTALAKCHRALSQLIERSIANAGLVLSDFMALEALLHKNSLSITEIQEKVLLASGSMTAAVDRLEKKGLIVRKTTAEDRRARLLELTPEGRHVAEAVFETHVKDLEELFTVLTEMEKRQLYAPLKKLGLSAAQKLAKDSGGSDALSRRILM